MTLIAAYLNAEVILVVTVYTPLPPLPHLSPPLISLMVSVDVKHHVYLPLILCFTAYSVFIYRLLYFPIPNKPYHGFCGRKAPCLCSHPQAFRLMWTSAKQHRNAGKHTCWRQELTEERSRTGRWSWALIVTVLD